MIDLGCLPQTQIDRAMDLAAESGRRSFCYAFMLDKTQRERERGITLELRSVKLETPKTVCTFYDASGLRDFVKLISQGCSHADSAVLIIAASLGEFEAGISQYGQTRMHALLAWAMGIRRLIVAVNKMDDAYVKFSEARFDEIKEETTRALIKSGFEPSKIQFIPMSAWTGENLYHPFSTAPVPPTTTTTTADAKSGFIRPTSGSTNMPWYVSGKEFAKTVNNNNNNNNTTTRGKTLIEAIDSLDEVAGPVVRLLDKPLRFLTDNLYMIFPPPTSSASSSSSTTSGERRSRVAVASGKIVSGHMKVGDVLVFEPGHSVVVVKRIEKFHEVLEVASAGDAVGVEVERFHPKRHESENDDESLDENNDNNNLPLVKTIRRGTVAGHYFSPVRPIPVSSKNGCVVKMVVMSHPGSIKNGYQPVVDIGSAHCACSLEIVALIDKKTGNTISIVAENKRSNNENGAAVATNKNPLDAAAAAAELKTGSAAIVRLTPVHPWKTFVCESIDFIPPLARVSMRDLRSVVAIGMVISTWKDRKWVFAIRAKGKEGSKDREAFQVWNILVNVALYIRPW